jgi:hypothetical protein
MPLEAKYALLGIDITLRKAYGPFLCLLRGLVAAHYRLFTVPHGIL